MALGFRPPGAAVRDALVKSVTDAQAEVREAAVRSLAAYAADPKARGAIEGRLDDGEKAVREAAEEALRPQTDG